MRKVSAVVNAAQTADPEIVNSVAKKSQKCPSLYGQTISCRCTGHTDLRLNGYKIAAKMLRPESGAVPEMFCPIAAVRYDAAV
jgi:hypothetical protein